MTDVPAPELILWLDSAGPRGWVAIGPDTRRPAMHCRTVGWVLHETDDEIVLAGSIGLDSDEPSCAHSPLTIPKFSIRHRAVLGGMAGSVADP